MKMNMILCTLLGVTTSVLLTGCKDGGFRASNGGNKQTTFASGQYTHWVRFDFCEGLKFFKPKFEIYKIDSISI